jgi:lambda family phage portal protein
MPKLNFMDRAVGLFSPDTAMERAVAREKLRLFEAEPNLTKADFRRGMGATATGQASSENWTKQRERISAIWEARAMEERFCIIAGILERLSMYVIGTLEYQSATGDEKADTEYEQYFHEWCGRADITGRHRLRTLAELGLRSMWRDGEHGWIEHLVDGELRLQAIEGDRIGNPNSPGTDEKNICGIQIDDWGKPVKYEIYKRTRTQQYEREAEVGPDRFIHLFRPTRSDQYHGQSLLKPALPHARDLYELLESEKLAAKFAASFAGFLRTGSAYSPTGIDSWDKGKDTKTGVRSMEVRPGMIVEIPAGEGGVDFAPGTQRPSGAFMALWEALIREMAHGFNLPFGFFYDMSRFGGVTARLETQAAERVFRRFREILINTLLDRVKKKVLLLGMARKEIRTVKDWNKGNWQFGAALSGDLGHQVNADALLVENGVKTRTQWAAELGYDLNDIVDQTAAEMEKYQRVSKQKSQPIELLNVKLPAPTENLANLAKAKAGITGEPPPPPGLIGQSGDKAAKGVVDVLTAVGRGELDADSARATLTEVYGMDLTQALLLLPERVISGQ